jgi:hypothetical protein
MTAPADNSAYSIICDALTDAGKLNRGDEPDSEILADAKRRLNDIIKITVTQGIKLWLQFDLPVPLVAGKNPYTIGPGGDVNMTKPLRVLDSCYYLDVSGNRRPLILLSRDDWMRLSQVTQAGESNSLFPDKQQSQLVINFWPPPSTNAATGVAHLLVQQQVTSFISTTDTMNFPDEWRMYLHWALADEMSTGQPAIVQQRCTGRANYFFNILNDWDVEDASTSFQPDARASQIFGKFR